MNWTHFVVLVIAVLLGLYIGSKNPTWLSKYSGGML